MHTRLTTLRAPPQSTSEHTFAVFIGPHNTSIPELHKEGPPGLPLP